MPLSFKARYRPVDDDNIPAGSVFNIYIIKSEGFDYRVISHDKKFPYEHIGYYSRDALLEDWEPKGPLIQLSLF